jgi:type VII secretion integral membrane protein EccD
MSLLDPALVRVTVASATRRVDLVLPGAVPVAELVPELARSVGLLDPTTVQGGYRLLSIGGHELAPDAGLTLQGVEHGAVITVTAGAATPPKRVYDDVVEAMADVVTRDLEPWSPERGRRVALWSTVLMMSLGAIALLLQQSSATSVATAGLTAAGLLIVAIVMSRREGDAGAALVVALIGAGFAAAAGMVVAGDEEFFGRRLAAGGSATMAAGLLAVLGLREGKALAIAPVVVGAACSATGWATDRLGWDPALLPTSAVTCLVLAGGAFPWLALGITRTDDDPLLTLADVTADPGEIDLAQVRADARLAHEILIGVSATVGVLMALVAPLTVSLGLAGTLLAVLSCLVVMLRTRRHHSAAEVLVGLASGVTVLGVVAASVLWLHPAWRPVVGMALTGAGAVLLASRLLPRPRSVRRSRWGDLVENVAMLSLLPTLVLATGLFDSLASRS